MTTVEIPRDQWGRPLIKPVGGVGRPKAYTRATTLAETLSDRFALEKWINRQTAVGLVRRPDLYALAAAKAGALARAEADLAAAEAAFARGEKPATAADARVRAAENVLTTAKRELDRVCEDAKEAAAASAKANLGTALHGFIEQINRGEEPFGVPAELQADVDAYRFAMQDWDVLRAEQFLVCDDIETAGTADVVARNRITGETCIMDVKTGAGAVTFGQGAVAIQLAIYAHGAVYHADTGDREPINVDQSTAVVIHLPAGTGRCNLLDVDILAGWDAVRYARFAREWRKHRNLMTGRAAVVMDPRPAALIGDVDPVAAKVNAAPTLDALRVIYGELVASGLSPAAAHQACAPRVAELTAAP